VSFDLYNELRNTTNPVSYDYGWETWYENIIPAAQVVYNANPNVLIFFLGLNYDLDIVPLVTGQNLGGGYHFDTDTYDFKDRMVYELHNYEQDQAVPSCPVYNTELFGDGWYDMNPNNDTNVKNRLPVVMTEWGFAPDTYTSLYAQCLKGFLEEYGVGWTMWDVCGSYYIRDGVLNFDETWGLLNANWTGWRNESAIQNYYIPLVQATLAGH